MEDNNVFEFEAVTEEPERTGHETDVHCDAPVHQQPHTKRSTGKVIALVLACAVVSGTAGLGGGILGSKLNQGSEMAKQSNALMGQRESTVISLTGVNTGKAMTPAEVYAANVNSTVGITTSITTNFWGYQTTSAASGSGFVLTDDGYILTNFHVIEDSDSITVTMYDGTAYDAELVGYDESNDIAVLKIDATGLAPVVLGDSDNMNVGDSVVAIGNPLGELTFSLTSGAVSALHREVTMSNGLTMNLIQTDCAINSGNSGGALFNLYGEVVGITNAKYSSNSGSGASIDNIGFAIPINSVRSIVSSIMEKGYISKPYIGVTVTDVSSEALAYGLPEGAAVRSVSKDSPAEKAGLQANDIITTVNGSAVTDKNDLVEKVGQAKIGDTLKLTVYRQGEKLDITVTVEEQIQDAKAETSSQQQQQQQQQQQEYYGGQFPWNFFGF